MRHQSKTRTRVVRTHALFVALSVIAPVGGFAQQPDVVRDAPERVVKHDADHPIAQIDVFEHCRMLAMAD